MSEAHKRGGSHPMPTQPHLTNPTAGTMDHAYAERNGGPHSLLMIGRTVKDQMPTCLVIVKIVQEDSGSVSTGKGGIGDLRSDIVLISTWTTESISRQHQVVCNRVKTDIINSLALTIQTLVSSNK